MWILVGSLSPEPFAPQYDKRIQWLSYGMEPVGKPSARLSLRYLPGLRSLPPLLVAAVCSRVLTVSTSRPRPARTSSHDSDVPHYFKPLVEPEQVRQARLHPQRWHAVIRFCGSRYRYPPLLPPLRRPNGFLRRPRRSTVPLPAHSIRWCNGIR